MAKLYDIVVAKNKYKNQQGEEKTSWLTVGAVFQGKNGGEYILLDRTFNPAALPAGENGNACILSLFKPKDKNTNNNATSSKQPYDEDEPF